MRLLETSKYSTNLQEMRTILPIKLPPSVTHMCGQETNGTHNLKTPTKPSQSQQYSL